MRDFILEANTKRGKIDIDECQQMGVSYNYVNFLRFGVCCHVY